MGQDDALLATRSEVWDHTGGETGGRVDHGSAGEEGMIPHVRVGCGMSRAGIRRDNVIEVSSVDACLCL